MYMRTLTVLMWKHWLVRKREYFSTLIEFVVPVLPFVLIFLLRDTLFPKSLSPLDTALIEVNEPEIISLRSAPGPPCVLYTPETNFTRILMGLVAQKLDLQLLKTLPRKISRRARGYFPFTNASNIFKYSKSMGFDEAVVIFHNISNISWPDSLSYSIRMKTPYDTYFRFTESNKYETVLVSHQQQGTLSETFLRLQWAIDTSFIEVLAGNEVKQNVTLRELPHLKYAQRSSTYAVKADILFFASGISIFPAFYNFMLRKILEKGSGVQDLMKIMGVTTYTLVTSHVLNSFLPGLIYSVGATVLLKLEPTPVLAKSNGFLIFMALLLQFVFTIFAAMVGSYLARRAAAPPTALTVSSVYIILTMPAYIWNGMDISKLMLYPYGLVPYMPLAWIFKEACKLEVLGPGLNFRNMLKSHSSTTGPALVAYIFLILHIFLCMIFFWYLDHVIPGLYGSTHPWKFPFKKAYWFKTAAEPDANAEQSAKQVPYIHEFQDPQYFEKPHKNHEIGIQVINVTKDFGNNRVLNNLSLDVYKGEVTILLGHNGAGKSTLMSVITGMTGVTTGKVLVNGVDTSSDKMLAHIGLCPQQNMFFENVTVIEHIMFFTLLNSGTFVEARKSSKEILGKLNLEEKANSDISILSGGMKRRVHLACALAGQADVLLLDEPTSGLDVESRRALWDMLLSLRGSRTVLLSTHYMDEADALGDRVVALHAGQLRCHATPMYLKRAIGSGYRLTFTTIGLPNEAAITDVVKSVVPEVTVKETGFNSISYNLPAANTNTFPTLFTKLESKRSDLGIDSIGVGTSTIEEVFLKLCSNIETNPISEDEIQGLKTPKYKTMTGIPLYCSQMFALMKRYLRFLWIFKYTQIGLGVIRVVILILVITFVTNDPTRLRTERTFWAMNLDLYEPLDYKIVYKLNGTDSDLRPLSDQYPRVHFERTSDVNEAVLREGQQDLMEPNILAAIELNDTDAKVLYTTKVQHAAPAALNLVSNLIVTRALPWAGGRTLTTYNHPISGAFTQYTPADVKEPKSVTNIKLWMFSTTSMLLSGVIFMIQLPCKDAIASRHIHVMAGCSPELHWAVMLLAATLQVLVTYVLTLALACSFLEYDDTFSDMEFIISASLVVILGSMAMLAFSYVITLNFEQSVAVGIVGITMIFFVLLFPILVRVLPSLATFKPAAMTTMPPYTFNEAMVGCAMTAYLNTLCKLNRDKCPNLAFPVPHFDAEKCCESKSNPWCYFCFEEPAPGKKIVYLIVQIFVYMILVILTQKGLFSLLWEKTVNYPYKPPIHPYHDDDVKAERVYVEKAIKLPVRRIPDMMLVSNVHKNFRECCSSYNAVRGVSFSVKKGECFGLLGVNGAGKSSMFQMLTADQCPTRGRIIANGREMTIPLSTKYLHSLSYSPQLWGLDDFLTGRQNLNLLLALKGLNARDIHTETMTWIKIVGLENYADQLVSDYSGGCLRRMAAALALCTAAPVTLLDEPTAGVDVAARHRVWLALKRGLRDKHAIIITSHSLDEMEALCHRISIMSAGEVCALGSPAELRAAHASGHSVRLKIVYEPTKQQRTGVTGATNPKIDLLKATIEEKFRCTLKDEHKTMLHYHINEVMHYSKIFEGMEELKASFSGIIEDYSVSETTLEEVFLSFAKSAKQDQKLSSADEKQFKNRKDVAAGPA